MTKLIFLSHIHEERELALLIKEALEEEFSGFVNVFVSSDGTSIPAGANFLKRIENGLANCAAALYLISPKSVSRQWINFELGAVWIRNVISTSTEGPEIPALPVCHSGSRPATLPAPLNNLNGIVAADSAQLEFAFRSIQAAMGGRGKLKTNFDGLAAQIIALERKYTVGAHLKEVLSMLPLPRASWPEFLVQVGASSGQWSLFQDFFLENKDWKRLQQLESDELKGLLSLQYKGSQTRYTDKGTMNLIHADVTIQTSALVDNKAALLS